MRFLTILLMMTFLCGPAQAYSYAAAGKEPLIDAREAIYKAISENDYATAHQVFSDVSEEIDYLDQEFGNALKEQTTKALNAKDQVAVSSALQQVFATEITRRLTAGLKHLEEYQTAKVLVVKSKRFFDAMAGELPGPKREAVDAALHLCLDAIGNPGVFGVGKRAADPDQYKTAMKAVLTALAQ